MLSCLDDRKTAKRIENHAILSLRCKIFYRESKQVIFVKLNLGKLIFTHIRFA